MFVQFQGRVVVFSCIENSQKTMAIYRNNKNDQPSPLRTFVDDRNAAGGEPGHRFEDPAAI